MVLIVLVFLVREKEGSFVIGAAGAVVHPSHTPGYLKVMLHTAALQCAALSYTNHCSSLFTAVLGVVFSAVLSEVQCTVY